jgi:hypothetical protein
MVLVLMCKQDGIKMADLFPEHLLAEIRSGINYNAFALYMDVH